MKEIWTEKYRPKNLDEVVGQKHVTERLKAYVSSNNMPHLLLTGPAGTGKTLSLQTLRVMFDIITRNVFYRHTESYHHRQHTEVGFLAHNPNYIVFLELTFRLNCAEMTFFVLNSNHHTMVTKTKVNILQSLSHKGTTFAKFDGNDG